MYHVRKDKLSAGVWEKKTVINRRKICSALMLMLAGACGFGIAAREEHRELGLAQAVNINSAAMPDMPLYAGVTADFWSAADASLKEGGAIVVAMSQISPEQQVYSFLQGPKSWGEGRSWAGEWSNESVKGNYFGSFGCGLCCMANVYCTLTGYICSPWDMYEYAKSVSGYSPTRKVGAIGWADMKVTLRKSGFDCSLHNKPDSYEAFQEQIRRTDMAVVLVCSRNDDTYWTHTGGHYVNISLYNAETDEVFLSDPGSPDRNRNWIPLRYVYDALKTASQYQYLLVEDYEEENNLWKQDGIDEAWVAPSY